MTGIGLDYLIVLIYSTTEAGAYTYLSTKGLVGTDPEQLSTEFPT